MEIKIITPCLEEINKVIYYSAVFCVENFKEFQLFIDGELKKEVKHGHS